MLNFADVQEISEELYDMEEKIMDKSNDDLEEIFLSQYENPQNYEKTMGVNNIIIKTNEKLIRVDEKCEELLEILMKLGLGKRIVINEKTRKKLFNNIKSNVRYIYKEALRSKDEKGKVISNISRIQRLVTRYAKWKYYWEELKRYLSSLSNLYVPIEISERRKRLILKNIYD